MNTLTPRPSDQEMDLAMDLCREEDERVAHDARDALNGAGIACPSSIALAAERARAALSKAGAL